MKDLLNLIINIFQHLGRFSGFWDTGPALVDWEFSKWHFNRQIKTIKMLTMRNDCPQISSIISPVLRGRLSERMLWWFFFVSRGIFILLFSFFLFNWGHVYFVDLLMISGNFVTLLILIWFRFRVTDGCFCNFFFQNFGISWILCWAV